MQKAIGTRLGFTAFWKTDYFSKYFSNFAVFFLCYYFLLRKWLRRMDLLLVFLNFRDKWKVLHITVGVYKYGTEYRSYKPFGIVEQAKIKKYRWKREARRPATTRYNRLGLCGFSTLVNSKKTRHAQFLDVIPLRRRKGINANYCLVLKRLLRDLKLKKKIKKKQKVSFWSHTKKKFWKLYGAHLRYAINAKPRPTGPQLKKINAFKYSLGLLKRAVRKSAAKGHRVLSVFGSKTKKIFSKKFLKILQKYWSMLFGGCSQDPISLYLKYLWFEKKKSHFKNYKILAIEKLKKKPISKSSEKLEPVIKNKPPKHIESSLSKGLYALLAAVKLVKSPSKALFFQKLVNLTLNRRIPFLKDKNKFLGWTLKKFRRFLSHYLEQNFKTPVPVRTRFRFTNVFKKTKLFSTKYAKFRYLLLSKLYRVPSKRLKSLKKRLFTNFFSLRNISFYILKQMITQWKIQFKRFPQFTDFINVVNLSLFFTRAEFLSETVAINILKNKRAILPILRQSNRILQYFYPIFCARPVNYSVRIGVFGKLGGQRKRKFKSFYLIAGSGNPRQQFFVPLDYAFQAFWNHLGSFGIKVWVYRGGIV